MNVFQVHKIHYGCGEIYSVHTCTQFQKPGLDTASEIHGVSLHCTGIVKLMYELTTHFSFAVH